jgi:MFS family permease
MYCSICGAESTGGLNYCKRCGANLNLPADAVTPRITPALLTWMFLAVIAVGGFGIMATFGSASDMAGRDNDGRLVVATVVATVAFGSAATCIVVSLLLRFLSRLMGLSKEEKLKEAGRAASFGAPFRRERAPEYDQPQPAALPASAPSVVEHTTRSLDHMAEGDHPREPHQKAQW